MTDTISWDDLVELAFDTETLDLIDRVGPESFPDDESRHLASVIEDAITRLDALIDKHELES